jgi:hypothetical protein
MLAKRLFHQSLSRMSSTATVQPLVSTLWLAENIHRTVPVDASWHMPNTGRKARQEFQTTALPVWNKKEMMYSINTKAKVT